MSDLWKYTIAATVGLIGYFLAFGLLLEKPLTQKPVADLVAFKKAIVFRTLSPKIAIIAGSNGRVSHSCAVIASDLGQPCVNLGTTANLSLGYMFEAFKPELRPGDTVYLPLEYQQYFRSRADLATGVDAAILFRHDKRALLSRDSYSILRAAFMFDLGFAVRAAGEMVLHASGVRRPFNRVDHPGAAATELSLNDLGDEIGHSSARAEIYRNALSIQQWSPATLTQLQSSDGGAMEVRKFLRWACGAGVRVVGGLPTVFDDTPVAEDAISYIREIFLSEKQAFLVLPNQSQYPRSAFYDSPYHLMESMQKAHSHMLAEELRPLLSPGSAVLCVPAQRPGSS